MFGIESVGIMTEKIKKILKKAGIRTYTKGGKRIIDLTRTNRKKKLGREQRGVVYMVKCVECDMVNIG